MHFENVGSGFSPTGRAKARPHIAGVPVRSENFIRAEIEVGRVGAEQVPPKREFD